jgi:protein arginine kinase activator
MLCQVCHAAEATVHLIETVNNKQLSLQICETCAQKKHLGELISKPAMAIHELLASILQLGAAQEPNAPDLKCPNCGLEYSRFTQVGRFGCPGCYDAFKERLLPLLRQFHQAEEHHGRQTRRTHSERAEIAGIKLKIREAVAHEDYEAAARLRDHIKHLEGKSPA